MTAYIKDGIADKLTAAYPDVPVSVESIQQGFTEPCFFISMIAVNTELDMNNRYRRNYLMNIKYFPSVSQNSNQEIEAVEESLYQILEYIEVDGDLVRGFDMSAEKADGVLVFVIRYPIRTYMPKEKPIMKELSINA